MARSNWSQAIPSTMALRRTLTTAIKKLTSLLTTVFRTANTRQRQNLPGSL